MSSFPATEREYIIADLVRRHAIPPGMTVAEVTAAVRFRLETSGYSGWTELAPRNTPEFFDEDGRVRPEWQEWPYHIRYSSDDRGIYVGSLYPKRRPEITWRELAEAAIGATLPPVPIQASLFDVAVLR